MNVHELIEEQTGLAKLYAEDGAFYSSARVLQELADAVQKHAQATAKALADMDRHANDRSASF